MPLPPATTKARAAGFPGEIQVFFKNKQLVTTFLSVILVTHSFPQAFADPNALPDFGEPGGEDPLFEDFPSVFGASKYEQRLSEAPASVSIVTADEIRKYGHRTMEDVLDSVRGFYTTNDRNYAYTGIRGFNSPGDYGTRILLLLDGQRLNDGLYDASNLDREFAVDVDLIERVEIIRGTGSSLYGSNAVLGIINVITKRGRDLKGVELAASGGSNDTREGRASYGNKYSNGAEILISGTGFDTDGDDRIYFPEFDDPATNNGVAENGDDEDSQTLFAKLSYADFTLQMDYNDRDKRFPTASYGTMFNDRRNKTSDKQVHLFLNYAHSFQNQVEINADINYGYYDYHGAYVYDYSVTAVPDPVIWDDDIDAEWWRYELQASVYTFDRHKLIAGVEYRDNSKQDQSNNDEFDIYLDSKDDSDIWGFYLQDEFRISSKLTLNAGIRHDDYDSFGGTTNPRAALIYNPLDKTTVKLTYGEAFRAPNAYELNYHDGFFTTKPPQNGLDPETSKSYELVLEQGIGRHINAVANIFHYKIDDLITYQLDPADGLLTFENVDEIETNGLGLELEGKWPSGWEGRISYSYQNAEDQTTGDDLSNSPEHLFKTNVIAPLFDRQMFAGLEYQYVGERKTISADDVDGYSLVNLTLNAPDVWGGLSIAGSVYNLFDEDYGDVASEEHVQSEIPQDGRTYRLKAYYRF
jgi:iron complex outermembrane receptor protein